MKTTAWYPGTVKPVRKGVYQREYPSNCTFFFFFSRFDGRKWFSWRNTAEEAATCLTESIFQNLPWRGLTEKAR